MIGHAEKRERERIGFENGFPASRVILWARSGSGPASPGRVCHEPEGPVSVFGDIEEQFASGWHRTRKHDN
ncbi:hypothetical protein Bca101_074102 [Brassica carinata]